MAYIDGSCVAGFEFPHNSSQEIDFGFNDGVGRVGSFSNSGVNFISSKESKAPAKNWSIDSLVGPIWCKFFL